MAQSVSGPDGARRTIPVRDLAAKLRITAALLGCASQKDLCARFRAVNPGTTFELERSYKWMQGRALPRSAQVYEDWVTLLGANAPIVHLQSCTVDEFLDLVCAVHHKVSRAMLVSGAEALARTMAAARETDSDGAPVDHHLVGAYACYYHGFSPYFEGRIVRGSLSIDATEGRRGLVATFPLICRRRFGGRVGLEGVRLSSPVTMAVRAICLDLRDAEERIRLSMCLCVPGVLANVLAGVLSGAGVVDSQPAASPICMVRIPDAQLAQLEDSDRYLDLTESPARDLGALGLRVAAPAELDAALEGSSCRRAEPRALGRSLPRC